MESDNKVDVSREGHADNSSNMDDVDLAMAQHSDQVQDNITAETKHKAVEADGEGQSTSQKNPFQVDTEQLRMVPLAKQATELQTLGLTVYNQQEFEEGIHVLAIRYLKKCHRKKLIHVVWKTFMNENGLSISVVYT